MTLQANQLLAEFPEHTYEQWHAAAEALLKGAPFEKMLVSRTYEEITIQPIYRSEDIAGLPHRDHFPGADSLVRGSHAGGFLRDGWEVSQELRAADAAGLNALIHEGLAGGQSELNVIVGCGRGDCCRGVALNSVEDVVVALAGVELGAVSTYWQAGPAVLPVAAMVYAAAGRMGTPLAKLRGGLDNDPLAEWVAKGSARQALAARYDHMAALTLHAAEVAPEFRTMAVRGNVYHNAGASAVQELGYVIATLVEYLEAMKERGVAPEVAMPRVRLGLAVGSDYFMEIAKLRAARWLWSRVADAYGVAAAPVHLHASTSRWNKTTYDAHTNMLRVTAEAFAAVVAGVDSLHIGPYDEISGRTDAFSRRISRNIHTILREECGLDRVMDPAGGSNYIEWLTDKVAAKAWEVFQGVERGGGMAACLGAGTVQEAVASVCQARLQNVRRRKDRIVGANMYPDLKGKKLAMWQPECQAVKAGPSPAVEPAPIAAASGAPLVADAVAAASAGFGRLALAAGVGLTKGGGQEVVALPARRAAEEYEALRDAAAAHAVRTGSAPAVLQLNIGPSRKYRLRADWTSAFFEAAGFGVDGARDFADVDAAVAAVRASGAPIAVITSDDATYMEVVAPLAAAVKAAKPEGVLLVAGAPGEHEAAWRAAGVDDFVNIRSNNYDLNRSLLVRAGVLQ